MLSSWNKLSIKISNIHRHLINYEKKKERIRNIRLWQIKFQKARYVDMKIKTC